MKSLSCKHGKGECLSTLGSEAQRERGFDVDLLESIGESLEQSGVLGSPTGDIECLNLHLW